MPINCFGRVWLYYEDGHPTVRCFMPVALHDVIARISANDTLHASRAGADCSQRRLHLQIIHFALWLDF